MANFNVIWLGALLTLLCPGATIFAAAESPEPIRILFIGNSYIYVNDLPRVVQLLAVQSGTVRLPQVRMVTGPGFTFEDHWKIGSALKALESDQWDYVVLQEQSQRPIQEKAKMHEFGTRLIQAAQQHGAKPLLFVTWSRAADPAEQEPISASYAELARNSGAQLVAVGPTWRHLIAKHPEINLYSPDGSHPSPVGTFLVACIFYKTIYGALPQSTATMAYESSQHSSHGYAQQTVPVAIRSEQLSAVRSACDGDPPVASAATTNSTD